MPGSETFGGNHLLGNMGSLCALYLDQINEGF